MLTEAPARTITLATLPALGQPLDEGLFAGLTTLPDGTHHAVVLLPAKPAEQLDWQAATAWAEEAGGQLPSRPEAALLFANLKPQFEEEWHWTREPHPAYASFAWRCGFTSGRQLTTHKSAELCARAVRLIPLSS